MTRDEIFKKLQAEVTIRGPGPGTFYTQPINVFLNRSDKPYEELEEINFRNYLLYLMNRGDLTAVADSEASGASVSRNAGAAGISEASICRQEKCPA